MYQTRVSGETRWQLETQGGADGAALVWRQNSLSLFQGTFIFSFKVFRLTRGGPPT